MTTPPPTGEGSPPAAGRDERLLACFHSALGHDLANQLVALRGLVQLLESEEAARLSDDGRDYLRRLAAAVERLDGRVRMLAEIARVGRGSEVRQEVPLGEVVREAAAEVRQVFPTRRMEYHCLEPLPVLPVARAALHRALVQLFRNAVRATPEGAEAVIEVGARPTADGCELWVADHGRGLSDDERRQLLAVLAGEQPAPTGGGLGLVLVRRVAEAAGGRVTVDSRPGQGSRFTLTLPRRPGNGHPTCP